MEAIALQAEKDAQAAKQAEVDAKAAKQQAETKKQQNTEYEQTQSPQEPIGNQVYIAGSGNGKKYHNNSSCSNMKNPVQISLDNAVGQGYSACKKCY